MSGGITAGSARVKDQHAFDLISDALPFGRSWYANRTSVMKLKLQKSAS
jgi:hypothetical protein